MKKLTTPLDEAVVRSLHAGDQILLSGVIWTGRDQAHKRLVALLDEGKPLPVELRDQAIYFVGPCPARPGEVIGSAGPTTSGRMDAYSPRLIRDCGLRGMIENDAYCNDVLIQSAAAGAVLNAFNRELIGAHLRGCVTRDLREGREEVVDELLLTLSKMMK